MIKVYGDKVSLGPTFAGFKLALREPFAAESPLHPYVCSQNIALKKMRIKSCKLKQRLYWSVLKAKCFSDRLIRHFAIHHIGA